MKFFYTIILLVYLQFNSFSSAAQITEQPVHFVNGNFITGNNISRQRFKQSDLQTSLFDNKYFALIQFSELPTLENRLQLKTAGVELGDYIPGNVYLAAIQPMHVPLRTNCRNTRIILDKVQTSLGADMGTRGAGAGPKIREMISASKEESAKLLATELVEIIDHGGISPGDVTILSPYPVEESCVALLPESANTSADS